MVGQAAITAEAEDPQSRLPAFQGRQTASRASFALASGAPRIGEPGTARIRREMPLRYRLTCAGRRWRSRWPTCGRRSRRRGRAFAVQLEEGRDCRTAANFVGGGCEYGFWCRPCGTAAFPWQKTGIGSPVFFAAAVLESAG
jgi:hypothetical protein